jgi:hypothetical protein
MVYPGGTPVDPAQSVRGRDLRAARESAGVGGPVGRAAVVDGLRVGAARGGPREALPVSQLPSPCRVDVLVATTSGPTEPASRAGPGGHGRGACVWAHIRGGWRPARVLSTSTGGVLLRYLLPSRGTGVDTVSWGQLAAGLRTEREPRIDLESGVAVGAVTRSDGAGAGIN